MIKDNKSCIKTNKHLARMSNNRLSAVAKYKAVGKRNVGVPWIRWVPEQVD